MPKQSVSLEQSHSTSFLVQQLRGLRKPFVAMAVGMPGSGKTTILSVVAVNLGIMRISPDDIREELAGSAADQSVNREAWAEAHKRVKQQLAAGRSVIVDATHADAKQRVEALKQYHKYKAAALVAVVFKVSISVAKQRNTNRQRVVPEYVLDRMHASLQTQPPTVHEGFDKVISVSTTK